MSLKPDVSSIPPFPYGLCCYLVPRDEHLAQEVERLAQDQQLSGAWLQLTDLEVRGRPMLAVSLHAIKDNAAEGGQPVAHASLAAALSEGRGTVLELIVAAGGEAAAIGLFQGGERKVDPQTRPLPASTDALLDGLSAGELADIGPIRALGMPLTGPRCTAMHLKRALRVPPGAPLSADIFRFSERDSRGLQDEDEAGRFCLLALDLEHLRHDIARSVKGAIHRLEHFANPEAKRFLGPMSVDLPPLLEELRHLEGNLPLRRSPSHLDLVELMALVNTRLSTPGNRVEYLDQVFFPLLNVSAESVPEALDADELPQLEELDILGAMADQLPYFAPEGALLESFADDELAPLLGELGLPGEDGGSLWLLRGDRLAERIEALGPPDFADLCDRFSDAWWKALGELSDDEKAERVRHRLALDQPALRTFFSTWSEIATLLAMARENSLQVALLFYE